MCDLIKTTQYLTKLFIYYLAVVGAPSEETIKYTDGNEYPLVKVEISSASHPFYTGKMKFVDSAGRVEKFQKKWSKAKDAAQ